MKKIELSDVEVRNLKTMLHIELQTYSGSHKDVYYRTIKNIHSKLEGLN